MEKHSCGINHKYVLVLQTDLVSKYKFRSSDVKPYLSPLFARFEKSLNMFLNNLYVCPFDVMKIIAKFPI